MKVLAVIERWKVVHHILADLGLLPTWTGSRPHQWTIVPSAALGGALPDE